MRLYLSSYGFGNRPEKLFELLRGEKLKVAIVTNAADFHPEEGIVEHLNDDVALFARYGYEAERLDLRQYFGNEKELSQKINAYGLIWVRGGNVFVLRKAMQLSGFDEIIKQKLHEDTIVYAGYSAGGCVLCPSLEGFDIVDDPKLVRATYNMPVDYSALSVLNYHFEPHYKSDHPESTDVDKEIEYLKKHKIPFKTLHDGEAIVIDGNKEELVG